jgi:hypothetical protein
VHRLAGVSSMRSNPDIVLVDTAVLAAPRRLHSYRYITKM